MNQTCKVCGEPAAGFHFGAFTCEGCKSFFGRSYNNLSSISECKNNGKCIIDKKNRTTCKACRLRKCYTVGMSKGGSRYGRRSNWFKIHCLLQEQQQQAVEAAGKMATATGNLSTAQSGFGDMVTAAAAAAAVQQKMHHQQQHQHNPHLVQHMNSLLGYPSYLPDMGGSPFMPASAACHPNESSAAAALPFFNMMNINSAPATFQLPPQIIFPSYHPAMAAAADVAYRSEMYKHRQSVDSAGSAASAESQCYTPPLARVCSRDSNEEYVRVASQSPDVCVADEADNEEHSVSSQKSHPASPTVSHTIYSPVAIRATALSAPITTTPVPAAAAVNTKSCTDSKEPLSFAPSPAVHPAKKVTRTNCTAALNQDCPIDLSMKPSRHSVHSFVSSACEVSDVCSDSSRSEEHELASDSRRKFYQINGGDDSESDLSLSMDNEIAKRQKMAIDEASFRGHAFGTGHSANSMRGIFLCV